MGLVLRQQEALMRKFSLVYFVIFLFSVFGFAQASFAKVAPKLYQEPAETNYAELSQTTEQSDITSQGTLDSRFEALTKEIQKSKELLAIWKDHVRTLTKERNDAYKEIETLKGQGVSSENTKAQSDNEAIVNEKEEATRELEYLKDKMTLLQKKYDGLKSENQRLQTALSQREKDRLSETELAALQAKAEKLTAAEKELQEAKDYFSSSMEELNAKTKKMYQENESLKSEIQNAKAEQQKQEELQQELAQLNSENGSLKLQNDRLQKTQAQQSKTIQTLKSTIQSSLDSLDANS